VRKYKAWAIFLHTEEVNLTENPPPLHLEITRAAESCFDQHPEGGTEAVGWSRDVAETQYRVMLDVVRTTGAPVSLLDFGCGLSHLYEYIRRNQLDHIQYSGLDISERFLTECRRKFPATSYYHIDVLDTAAPPMPAFDYVVMNGIFTYMGRASDADKFAFLRALIRRVFEIAKIGIAFNVISKQVEWERDDLFHLPLDPLLTFLSREVSRHVVIRHDYGLYEYTVYIYKTPTAPQQSAAKQRLNLPPANWP
jgi:SAM-dependent methyltransferase